MKKGIEDILNDAVYKQVIKDSFGGVMYDMSKNYKASHLISIWEALTPSEKDSADGIVKGAMSFLVDQSKQLKK